MGGWSLFALHIGQIGGWTGWQIVGFFPLYLNTYLSFVSNRVSTWIKTLSANNDKVFYLEFGGNPVPLLVTKLRCCSKPLCSERKQTEVLFLQVTKNSSFTWRGRNINTWWKWSFYVVIAVMWPEVGTNIYSLSTNSFIFEYIWPFSTCQIFFLV